ncbi:MAG: sigma-70 family RNA polymerase sigma factor [Candidatus Binatia bacterium]
MVWRGKSKIEERERFSHEALDHLDHLYRVAFHLAREPAEARDLVQETYLRALDSFEQFSPGTNMKAWLTRILYNFFLDLYHQRKKWVSLEGKGSTEEEGVDYWERVAGEDPGPENSFLVKELKIKISEALRKIPEEFRAPIVLVDMGELSYAEAAEVLSCPLGTIRSRLSRGRRYLHMHLKRYMGLEGERGRKRQK